MKGYVHVYTGNGKGKTTAALGLAVRAAGAGLKVYIAQFAKYGEYSEIKGLKRLSDSITIEQFGRGRFIKGRPSTEDVKAARAAEPVLAATNGQPTEPAGGGWLGRGGHDRRDQGMAFTDRW